MKRISFIKTIPVFLSVLFAPVYSATTAMAQAQNPRITAQQVANHFSAIRTMTGDFVQFGPKGEMTEGTFYLERPGKIRFVYKNSPIRVISDGKSIVINNKKLDTWSLYQLKQTPMKLLLDDHIDLSHGRLLAFRQEPAAITMIIADNTIAKTRIRMIFDAKTYALRQWTVIDRQNHETTVQLTNARTGVRFADGMFTINYQRIATKRGN